MGKQMRKVRRERDSERHLTLVEPTHYSPPRTPQPLRGQTENQRRFIRLLQTQTVVFGVGAAGTGKTYCAVAVAADALRAGEVERIVLTRPMVSAEDDIGALPGTVEEKIAPYIAPVRHILDERLGRSTVDYEIKAGRILAIPVAFMRGHSLANSFIIADEAQNLKARHFKMLLTRVGAGSRIAITGDTRQSDIRDPGLDDALRRVASIAGVGVVEFERADCVRSDICAEILAAYDE